jgi:hypothetical protein
MHAILLISATHLSYLLPNESTYHRASALHLSQTLRMFRHALSQPVTQHNADALMATSLLLVHHAWAAVDNIQTSTASDHSADQNQPSVASSYQAQLDLSSDPLFSHSGGARRVFMAAIDLIAANKSIFAPSAVHRPRNSLMRATAHAWPSGPGELEEFFSRCYTRIRLSCPSFFTYATPDSMIADFSASPSPLSAELNTIAGRSEDDIRGFEEASDFTGFTDAASRLVLVLALIKRLPGSGIDKDPNHAPQISQTASTLDLAGDVSNPPLPPITDLARYLFSFPTRSTPSFISLVQRNDPSALLILFYYYRAVHLLLPEKQCWWSQKRAEYLVPAIERTLQTADVETRRALEDGKRLLEEGVPLWAVEALRGVSIMGEQELSQCLLARIGLDRK